MCGENGIDHFSDTDYSNNDSNLFVNSRNLAHHKLLHSGSALLANLRLA
jgi:hypothetical protein